MEPPPKKKQRALPNPADEWIAVARNTIETTITADDRTAMQNARQRQLQGFGNHNPSMHIVVPDANNLPNAGQRGFLNNLEAAVDAALAPVPPEEFDGTNRLLEAATLLLNTETPSIPAPVAPITATKPTPTDTIDDDDDDTSIAETTAADTTTAIIQRTRTRPQQRRNKGRLSSNIRLARQQSNRNNIIPIDADVRRELLNLNKAKKIVVLKPF